MHNKLYVCPAVSKTVGNRDGFTLVEVLAAFSISTIIFAAILAAFLTVKSVDNYMRHRVQAMEIVRGRLEKVKRTQMDTVPCVSGLDEAGATEHQCDSPGVTTVSVTASYDAGNDGLFGTADDMKGTLTTTIMDGLDLDGDGNTAETAIDVNGDGINDPSDAKPVRVTFTWTEKIYGQTKTFSVFADTLISA